MREPLAGEFCKGAFEVARLLFKHCRIDDSCAGLILPSDDLLGEIEDDGNRGPRRLFCDGKQRGSGPGLYAGGIDDRHAASSKAHFHESSDKRKGLLGGGLIGLVVADHRPAAVRRDYLGGAEVAAGEGGFPRARRSDQQHQPALGYPQLHVLFCLGLQQNG